MSSKLATLRELEEHYSLEDALNMLEIIRVNTANERIAAENKD